MARKAKVTVDEKVRVIKEYLSGKKRVAQICLELQVTKDAFGDWLRKYRTKGEYGLYTPSKNTSYSEEVKLQAISDYENGIGSLDEICSKYDISGGSILRRWIKKYNGYGRTKSHNSQEDKSMTKGRKTTFEERVEIVSFCIANNDNYQLTCERFEVSYQQIYSWSKKYKERGSEALVDNRGKNKENKELSESEIFAAQLKLLEAENRRLKMENDFLKKLNEIERRR